MDRIYVGIVSFNPDIEKLCSNIDAIKNQVECIVVFDNGSKNQKEIVNKFINVEFIISDSNIGIAGALNRLIQWGKERDFQWMISLDQDSVCPDTYVDDMCKFLHVEDDIGILAPVIVDRNIGIVGHNPSTKWKNVRTCITSGSFNSIEAWKRIEGYDESMFIDSVDFEYCYRLRKNGYKVVQVSEVQLLHELGESERKKVLIWSIEVNRHSAFRKYYIAKNNVYYPLKHRLWLHFVRGNIRNVWLLFIVLIYEDNQKEKIKSILRGWNDGLKKK